MATDLWALGATCGRKWPKKWLTKSHSCPADAVVRKPREDEVVEMPATAFRELHHRILNEKKLKRQ